MPHLTELRCRACVMLGGTTIENQAEADELTALPRLRIKGVVVRVGDVVSLPHCLSSDAALATFAKERGRPCPRVELAAENDDAMNVFSLSARADARHLVDPYLSTCTASRARRRALLLRVARTLMDREVTEALYPPPPSPKTQGRA